MKVVFLTNYPSPYRVWFFNELGKHVDLTVLFTESIKAQTHRSASWFDESYEHFKAVFLKEKVSLIKNQHYFKDVFPYLQKDTCIILGGYASLTQMLSIAYMRRKKIPFYIEIDGGLPRPDSFFVRAVKKYLISGASGWISSGKKPSEFLQFYGADPLRIHEYRFSSLWERDIFDAVATREEKNALRDQLHMTEPNIALCVGNYIPRKGLDVLIRAAARLPADVGIYIVGGKPTEEYLQLKEALKADNVHFVGFIQKEALKDYYRSADLMVLPTREDIWGLVVNEAMAAGLPVVTTDRCVAGLELVSDGENGFIVPVEDDEGLAAAISQILSTDTSSMGQVSLARIQEYTIENMVQTHLEILKNFCSSQR